MAGSRSSGSLDWPMNTRSGSPLDALQDWNANLKNFSPVSFSQDRASRESGIDVDSISTADTPSAANSDPKMSPGFLNSGSEICSNKRDFGQSILCSSSFLSAAAVTAAAIASPDTCSAATTAAGIRQQQLQQKIKQLSADIQISQLQQPQQQLLIQQQILQQQQQQRQRQLHAYHQQQQQQQLFQQEQQQQLPQQHRLQYEENLQSDSRMRINMNTVYRQQSPLQMNGEYPEHMSNSQNRISLVEGIMCRSPGSVGPVCRPGPCSSHQSVLSYGQQQTPQQYMMNKRARHQHMNKQYMISGKRPELGGYGQPILRYGINTLGAPQGSYPPNDQQRLCSGEQTPSLPAVDLKNRSTGCPPDYSRSPPGYPSVDGRPTHGELKLSYPVRNGVLLKPFQLPHDVSSSSYEFLLTENICQVLSYRSDLELHLKCFHCQDKHMTTNWPLSLSVFVNGVSVPIDRGNGAGNETFGNTTSSGRQKPLNLKPYCRVGKNIVTMNVCACCCSHLFMLHLVHIVTLKSAVVNIVKKYSWSMQESFNKFQHLITCKYGSSFPSDGIRLSLRCPISGQLLSIPARGIDCQHIQCFDLESYLRLNCDQFTWRCPLCPNPVPIDGLMVDQYTTSIVRSSPTLGVLVSADGQWKPYSGPIINDDLGCINYNDNLRLQSIRNYSQRSSIWPKQNVFNLNGPCVPTLSCSESSIKPAMPFGQVAIKREPDSSSRDTPICSKRAKSATANEYSALSSVNYLQSPSSINPPQSSFENMAGKDFHRNGFTDSQLLFTRSISVDNGSAVPLKSSTSGWNMQFGSSSSTQSLASVASPKQNNSNHMSSISTVDNSAATRTVRDSVTMSQHFFSSTPNGNSNAASSSHCESAVISSCASNTAFTATAGLAENKNSPDMKSANSHLCSLLSEVVPQTYLRSDVDHLKYFTNMLPKLLGRNQLNGETNGLFSDKDVQVTLESPMKQEFFVPDSCNRSSEMISSVSKDTKPTGNYIPVGGPLFSQTSQDPVQSDDLVDTLDTDPNYDSSMKHQSLNPNPCDERDFRLQHSGESGNQLDEALQNISSSVWNSGTNDDENLNLFDDLDDILSGLDPSKDSTGEEPLL